MLNVVTSAHCSREENKRVEFGAKVNNIQINGISFIGHHSFEAFKGIRLKQTIACQEELTGVKSGMSARTLSMQTTKTVPTARKQVS